MSDPTRARPAARIASIAGWIVIMAVVARIASGGGTLRGVNFVLLTEPLVAVLAGAMTLLAAAVALFDLLRARPGAWRLSIGGGLVALVTHGLLYLVGHESALLGAAAAVLVIGAGVLGRRRGPPVTTRPPAR